MKKVEELQLADFENKKVKQTNSQRIAVKIKLEQLQLAENEANCEKVRKLTLLFPITTAHPAHEILPSASSPTPAHSHPQSPHRHDHCPIQTMVHGALLWFELPSLDNNDFGTTTTPEEETAKFSTIKQAIIDGG